VVAGALVCAGFAALNGIHLGLMSKAKAEMRAITMGDEEKERQ
jgi:hypothetical protein